MNKTSFLKTLVTISICVLILSCDSDDSPSPQEEMPPCRPTQITSGDNEIHLEYNANGSLLKYWQPFDQHIKYEYNDNRPVRLTYYSNDESSVLDIDEITYNNKGQWTQHNFTKSNDQTLATYDGMGNRTEVVYKANNKISKRYTYKYTNGNMTEKSISYYNDDASLSFTLYYTYEYDLNVDNKLRFFESLVQYGYLVERGLGKEPTPSKNILKAVNTLSSDRSTVTTRATIEYEFNENGFPTKITVSGDDINGDGQNNADDIFVSNYEYVCD